MQTTDTHNQDDTDGTRHRATPRRRWRNILVRLAGAAAAGAVLAISFAPANLWAGAIASATALTLLLWQQTWRTASAIGFVYGLTVALIGSRYFLAAGSDTWIAMSVAAAVFFIPQSIATVILMRLKAWPLLIPLTWTLQELPQATLIFDGFPWIRLGLTQIDAPWNGIYALAGIPGATWAAAAIASCLAAVIIAASRARQARQAHNTPEQTGPDANNETPDRPVTGRGKAGDQPPAWPAWQLPGASIALVAVTAAITGSAATLTAVAPQPNGSSTVAVIQGNIDPTSSDNREWNLEIIRAHEQATRDMWQAVQTGQTPRPDIIIWPENSLDLAPINEGPPQPQDYSDPTRDILDRLTADIDIPIVVGYSQRTPPRDGEAANQQDGPLYNRMQIWTAQGGGDYYNKRSLFTFGEYIPMRSVFEPLIGAERLSYQVDLTHGTEPGMLTYTQTGPDGQDVDVTMGVVICFEIGVDFAPREAIAAGGQYLTLGTNSYTWRNTHAPEQQFTAARIRAIETNRDTVVSGVTGPSGLINRHGETLIKTQDKTQTWFVTDVTLAQGETIAVRWGEQLEQAAFALIAAAAISIAAARMVQRRRGTGRTRTNANNPAGANETP